VLPVAFEPRWRAASPGMRDAVRTVAREILDHEDTAGTRRQRRRWSELVAFESEVERLLCNVAALRIAKATLSPLAIARRHQCRAGSKTRTRLLDSACSAGLLRMGSKGYSRGDGARFATLWHAQPALLACLPDCLHLADLRLASDELARIRIRDAQRNLLSLPRDAAAMVATVAALAEWTKRTPVSLAGEEAWLAEVAVGTGLAAIRTALHVDLYRVFNGDLEHGGRLYGGFWLHMEKAARFARLRLAGQHIAECDYSAMHLRLAYRHCGVAWPFADGEDAYTAGPGARAGWKRVTNALLQTAKPLRQWPGEKEAERAACRAHFAVGARPSRVVAAIKARHPQLADAGAFERSLGGRLTRVESDLMVSLLLESRARDLPALPLHDCLLVPANRADEAAQVMREIAKRALGVALPVGITRS